MRGRIAILGAALAQANPEADADALDAALAAERPIGPPRERARFIARKQGRTYPANGQRECARRQAKGEAQ